MKAAAQLQGGRVGGGETSLGFFWKLKKVSLFGEKNEPDCVHPWVKFFI